MVYYYVKLHKKSFKDFIEESLNIPLTSLHKWVIKGGWAILDQGLFSGANFLVNILLARWLPPKEYGAFAVALSVYYLLLNFHTAVLTEPMMVFGAGKYREHFRKYLGLLLWGHWGVSALISLALGGAALVAAHAGSRPLARALAGLAIAAPFLLLFWLTRRACYVEMCPIWALSGSALNAVLVLAGLVYIAHIHRLSSFSGLLLLGGVGLVSALQIGAWLRPQLQRTMGKPALSVVVGDHFRYGRWATGTVLLMWVPGNIAYTLLPVWAGLQGSAQVRAVMNFVLPVQQGLAAISLLILPHFSSLYTQHNLRLFRKRILMFIALFLSIAFAYGSILFGGKDHLIAFFYKGRYPEVASLLPLALLLPFVAGMNAVVGAALRAMERPDRVFFSYIFTSLVALTVGVALMMLWGVKGALWSMVLSTLTTSVAMTYFLAKEFREGA